MNTANTSATLLLDIGNTCVKWAMLAGDRPGPMQSARHAGSLPIDLLAAWEVLPPMERILGATVGPPSVIAALERTCAAYWRCRPQWVRIDPARADVRLAYAAPEQFGIDRWLALLAAHARAPGAKLVVDAGTAITYDLLCADGTHLGGLILPGLTLLRESLRQASQIPPHPPLAMPLDPGTLWGSDTASGIELACLLAPSTLAGRLWRQLRARENREVTLLLTGGDAERLLPWCEPPVSLQPGLVLDGLALLATNSCQIEREQCAAASDGHTQLIGGQWM